MKIPNWMVNLGLRVMSLPPRISLSIASRYPKAASAWTLRRILRNSRETEYGREHHFSILLKIWNKDQFFRLFEKSITPSEYESFRPYVERHKKGEKNVLVPGKPLMYATTSGTTSQPKWIPITTAYMKTVYSKMSHIWLYNIARMRPKWISGGIMLSVAKAVEGYAEDGTIYGSVSGVTAKGVPSFIRDKFVTPEEIFEIKDYNARYYALMRLAIEHNVTAITAPNPSTILELIHNAEEHFDEYIEDIENGTISKKYDIPPAIRSVLLKNLKKNPERAEVLRQLKLSNPVPRIKDWWPELQVIAAWRCGNTAIAAAKVMESLPECCLYQELGFFASECRFGLVMDEGIETTLFPNYHYYEFVEETDLEQPNPRFWRLHELQEGKRYCIFVTTLSGLYRYNMNDLVEVGGWYHKTPQIHLVQKVNGIVSITGEKLYEKQFIDAVRKAEEETGMKTNFFIGFADPEKSRYDFYYEFKEKLVLRPRVEKFTSIVDRYLQEMNIEYESKRQSLRLKAPKAHILRRNAYDLFKKIALKEGARDGQFKLVMLLQDKIRQKWINSLTDEK